MNQDKTIIKLDFHKDGKITPLNQILVLTLKHKSRNFVLNGFENFIVIRQCSSFEVFLEMV